MLGARRPIAPIPFLRAFQRSLRSASLWARRSSNAPFAWLMDSTVANSSAIRSGSLPSHSTSSRASEPSGYCRPKAALSAPMIPLSIISSAAGITPDDTIAETHSVAWRTLGKATSAVSTHCGVGVRRTQASVTMPKVPSPPTISERKSGPGARPDREPIVQTSPLGSTRTTWRIWG